MSIQSPFAMQSRVAMSLWPDALAEVTVKVTSIDFSVLRDSLFDLYFRRSNTFAQFNCRVDSSGYVFGVLPLSMPERQIHANISLGSVVQPTYEDESTEEENLLSSILAFPSSVFKFMSSGDNDEFLAFLEGLVGEKTSTGGHLFHLHNSLNIAHFLPPTLQSCVFQFPSASYEIGATGAGARWRAFISAFSVDIATPAPGATMNTTVLLECVSSSSEFCSFLSPMLEIRHQFEERSLHLFTAAEEQLVEFQNNHHRSLSSFARDPGFLGRLIGTDAVLDVEVSQITRDDVSRTLEYIQTAANELSSLIKFSLDYLFHRGERRALSLPSSFAGFELDLPVINRCISATLSGSTAEACIELSGNDYGAIQLEYLNDQVGYDTRNNMHYR